jgi:hypothetical protein
MQLLEERGKLVANPAMRHGLPPTRSLLLTALIELFKAGPQMPHYSGAYGPTRESDAPAEWTAICWQHCSFLYANRVASNP